VLIDVQNLNILYKDYIYVEGLNFFIDKGEILSIVGEAVAEKH
jgi:hypothetical protein